MIDSIRDCQRVQSSASKSSPKLTLGASLPISFFVAAIVVVAICPVLLVALPAMVDYPNHVARMYVLAAAGTPDANPFYEISKTLYSNLAMDLLVPPLARIVGVEPASKVFLIACQLLIVSGAIALELAVKRRHEISGLAAVMLLYSFPFAWGFLNFQFGLGVALWGLAVWEFMRGRTVGAQLIAHSLFVTALYVAHLFALGLYAATLGFLELSRFNWRRSGILQLAMLGAPMLGVFAVLLASPTHVGNGPTEWIIGSKFMSIFGTLNGYSTKLPVVEATALIALCYVLFRTRRLSLGHSGLWLAGGFALLFLVTPYRLFGVAGVDFRVPIAALLILPAYTTISVTGRAATLAAVVPIGIALINVAVTTAVWLSYQDDYAKMKASFTLLDRPSRILVGHSTDGPIGLLQWPMDHAPTLAVSAKAMVTTVALPGITSINVVKEHRNQAIDEVFDLNPVPLSRLTALATGTDDPRVPRFLRHWTSEFDYLYLVGPRIENPLPGRIEELTGGKLFTMYRISQTQEP
ncbi:hypothetical protein ABIB82_007460 [Bradyrhizobium sp. i1.8.4]|uniref:hypothetical protein n=1 Tax=unclassified Bradyrhizobium TaxID=2631580 RepID=UPI003D1AE4F3